MAFTMRELTDAEKEAFLQDNSWGILAFAGGEPYAIPVGYRYIKRDLLFGFAPTGRKMEYVNKSRNVCFTICQPTTPSPDSKETHATNTVIIEGELEDITETDRASYGLEPLPADAKVDLFRIKQKRVGTQRLGSDS